MTSPSRYFIILAGTLTLLAAGCADQNARPSNQTPAPTPSTATSTSDASTAPSPATASGDKTQEQAATTSSDQTGIPACDDYLASYKGCHRAAGIYAPDTIDAHYKDMRDTLLKESRDPDKRSALAARCISLAKLLKDSLHGESCEPAQPANASSSH